MKKLTRIKVGFALPLLFLSNIALSLESNNKAEEPIFYYFTMQ